MKKSIIIVQHSRGNHSAQQVYYHGRTIFEGNATEARAELVRMRKSCRSEWHEACTDDRQADYVDYKMGDVFALDITDGTPRWFW